MITKADRMLEAGDLPLWGRTRDFRKVSLSGFRALQTAGDTGPRAAPLDKFRGRPSEAEASPLYNYVRITGCVPVCTGAALRPQWPPSGGFARAMLILRNPWREATDLRPTESDSWAPEFARFLESESCPMALKSNVERPRAANRARLATWKDPTPSDVVGPADLEENDPMLYARQGEAPGGMGPELSDFRYYGYSHEWSSVSQAIIDAGLPGFRAASVFLPKRSGRIKSAGRRDDRVALAKTGGEGAVANPNDANPEQKFEIPLALQTIRNWAGRSAAYKPIRLLTSGLVVGGKSFVIHALCAMVRNLLGPNGRIGFSHTRWSRRARSLWRLGIACSAYPQGRRTLAS